MFGREIAGRIPAGRLRPRKGLRPANKLTLNKVDGAALMLRLDGRKSALLEAQAYVPLQINSALLK